MGYDLYMENTPDRVAEAYDVANKTEDEEAWRTYFDAQKETKSYWHETVFTMSQFRAVVEQLSMLTSDEAAGQPDDLFIDLPIPVGRLGSNDGWLISESQCLMMATRMADMLVDDTEGRDRLVEAYTDGTVDVDWETNSITSIIGAVDEAGGYDLETSAPAETDRYKVLSRLISMHGFFKACATGGGFRVW